MVSYIIAIWKTEFGDTTYSLKLQCKLQNKNIIITKNQLSTVNHIKIQELVNSTE